MKCFILASQNMVCGANESFVCVQKAQKAKHWTIKMIKSTSECPFHVTMSKQDINAFSENLILIRNKLRMRLYNGDLFDFV